MSSSPLRNRCNKKFNEKISSPPQLIQKKRSQKYFLQRNPAIFFLFIFISACLVVLYLEPSSHREKLPILRAIAANNMNWVDSTTAAPISAPSVLAKFMLSNDPEHWSRNIKKDAELLSFGVNEDGWRHTVPISAARRAIELDVIREIQDLCEARAEKCNPNERDPEFGMTPLHWARLFGDNKIADYLLDIGADPEIEDVVGRKPLNMTYQNFSYNSKMAAIRRNSQCQIPEILVDHAYPEIALSEVRRLVGEGEPVIVRNILPYLVQKRDKLLYPTSAEFSKAWGDREVDVAGVPYAAKFNVTTHRTTLANFRKMHMDTSDDGVQINSPLYVFQLDDVSCEEGYELMRDFAMAGLPTSKTRDFIHGPLICPPIYGPHNIMHYYMGNKGTGAPFHIHSDAINLMVTGSKRWWIMPPREATFSRMHINEWHEKHKVVTDENLPMECVQEAGDLMYVPFDWGHAALNEADDTFGYTMELTNRRDTFMSVMDSPC